MSNEDRNSDVEPTTRERLLEAGMEQFATKGFQKTTVRDLCKQADANLNAIKHHYGDKWELYLAVLERCRTEGGTCTDPEIPPDASAEKQLQLFVHAVVKTMFKRRQSSVGRFGFQLMMREIQNPTGALKIGMGFFIMPLWKQLNSILEQLLPDDVDPVTQHLLAFTVLGQINSYRFNDPIMRFVISKTEYDRISAKRVADHITRVTLAAARSYHLDPEDDQAK
ncbi:MAG: CerR family C-terminal domain-containing protein [Planctomycetota bacterium]